MDAYTDTDSVSVDTLRRQAHPFCVACSEDNPTGFHLKFTRVGPSAVEAGFSCPETYEGYSGRLHGGIIALLVDSAMTNCLFSLGSAAVTAELTIRYAKPILTGTPVTIRARRLRTAHGLHYLETKILQRGRVKITATGTFMDAPRQNSHRGRTSK